MTGLNEITAHAQRGDLIPCYLPVPSRRSFGGLMFTALIEFFRPGKVQKTATIFSGRYSHEITVSQIRTKTGLYADVRLDCFGTVRYRLKWTHFAKQIEALDAFRDRLDKQGYLSLTYAKAPIYIPSPMLTLINVYTYVGASQIILRAENDQPIMSMQVCKENDDYKVIFGIMDQLEGSLVRITIDEALRVLDSLTDLADGS